jgi:hypothetical protein
MLAQTDRGVLGFDKSKKFVIHAHTLRLEPVSDVGLLDVMLGMARIATYWRETLFLSENIPEEGSTSIDMSHACPTRPFIHRMA